MDWILRTSAVRAQQILDRASGGSRPGVCGGSPIGGAKDVSIRLMPKVVCDNRCVSHKRGYLLQVKKWLFLLVELCFFFQGIATV